MGACFEIGFIKAENDTDLKRMYGEYIQELKWEYGHQAYNGTWSTLCGVKIVPDPYPDIKFNRAKQEKLEEWIADHADKWEYALAIFIPERKVYIVGGWCSE